MIALPAHIMGIPVEETFAAFAPIAVVSFGALRATIGTRRTAGHAARQKKRGARPRRSANPH